LLLLLLLQLSDIALQRLNLGRGGLQRGLQLRPASVGVLQETLRGGQLALGLVVACANSRSNAVFHLAQHGARLGGVRVSRRVRRVGGGHRVGQGACAILGAIFKFVGAGFGVLLRACACRGVLVRGRRVCVRFRVVL
jgi:hypothetical protein